MIRNKAIVNEENSDADYWRKKYFALLKTTNNGTNPIKKKVSHPPGSDDVMMEVDDGMRHV